MCNPAQVIPFGHMQCPMPNNNDIIAVDSRRVSLAQPCQTYSSIDISAASRLCTTAWERITKNENILLGKSTLLSNIQQ